MSVTPKEAIFLRRIKIELWMLCCLCTYRGWYVENWVAVRHTDGYRSSACWQELSCTSTHYFTQPMPNPIAWYAHHAPEWFHRLEVALTFFEQLVLPFFLLVPQRRVAMIAGSLEIFFQVSIVLTGNYAWINWVGALPCLAVFDDQAWSWLIHRRSLQGTKRNAASAQQSGGVNLEC
eukprot:m.1283619 g.1283619  ORF g.1283619 m.1283619 type:complete len:177 (-) comp24776_c0_seq95:3795-4325(-)